MARTIVQENLFGFIVPKWLLLYTLLAFSLLCVKHDVSSFVGCASL